MAGRPDLVIALHGSSHPGAAGLASALGRAVSSRLEGVAVRTAWVDERVRTLDAALGGGRVVVVPGFLTAGYHVLDDLPGAAAGRAVVTGHVGPHLIEALVDRVGEAGTGDAILLAAAGSLRAEARAEVERVGGRLGGLLGVPVRVGYVYGQGSTVEEAFAELSSDGFRDVTVAAYFLAPGLYEGRLTRLGAARVTGPLGDHRVLVDALARLYLGAEEEWGAAEGASAESASPDSLRIAAARDAVADRAELGEAQRTEKGAA